MEIEFNNIRKIEVKEIGPCKRYKQIYPPKKKKVYVITLSKVFPVNHPRRGDDTDFYLKMFMDEKLHTIRGNYQFWKRRIDEVNAGNAVLEIRQWTGKPYCSKQETKFVLNSGLGYQKINVKCKKFVFIEIDNLPLISVDYLTVIENDGLNEEDFKAWFKKDLTDGIIIHFTYLRY